MIVLMLLVLQTQSLFAVENVKPPVVMPDGYENIYIGMPLIDFIKVRKNIKSGTNWFIETMDNGGLPWINDPNNPRKIDWNRDMHRFVENSSSQIFNLNTTYDFFQDKLDDISWTGVISSMFPGKIKKTSAEVMSYAFAKWGIPDDVLVLESKGYKEEKNYRLIMLYVKDGVRVYVGIPVKWEKRCVCEWKICIDEWFCRFMGKMQANQIFTMTIHSGKYTDNTWNGRVLPKTERDQILKETDYTATLEQLTKNEARRMKTVSWTRGLTNTTQ